MPSTYRPFLARRLSLILLVALATAAGYRLVTVLPDQVESGNNWKSPDGRFRLDAWSRSGVSFWGSRPDYYELMLTDLPSGRVFSRVPTDVLPGEGQMMYGAESVNWAADHSAVTVTMGSHRQIQLPLPR